MARTAVRWVPLALVFFSTIAQFMLGMRMT